MSVTLTDDEVGALKKALDSYLPELAFEIARIDLEADRHDVAREERILQALRKRLDRAM